MLSRRNSVNFSLERVAYYVEKATKNPFLNLGVGLFIMISTLENWDTWYATINNGKIQLHHGITVAGIWQVLASLPDVCRSLYDIGCKFKNRKRRNSMLGIGKGAKTTLLVTLDVAFDIIKKLLQLHKAGVGQEIIDEIHALVTAVGKTVEIHWNNIKDDLKKEDSDEH